MHFITIAQLLILLTVANGTPVVVKRIFGDRFAFPLDGHVKFIDGRPLFGPSKTVRGFLVSIAATALAAPLLGLDLSVGLTVGMAAMAGDLLSSFMKRRIGLASSSRATGLDQIPEALLPLLACAQALSLTIADVVAGTAAFFLGEVVLSRLLFAVSLRDRPY